MCGIVGYTGAQLAAPILLRALAQLEYRGYDSAGIAWLDDGRLSVCKQVGRVKLLRRKITGANVRGHIGIGHTRWATHGQVSEANAHPHLSDDGRFALVHNGVIENHLALKEFLLRDGCRFHSDTDSEVLCNLIAYVYRRALSVIDTERRFAVSVRKALTFVQGTYAIAVLCRDCPREIVAARKASPLLVGIGGDEFLIASDVSAIADRTRSVVYLRDGEMAHVAPTGFTLWARDQTKVVPVIEQIVWSTELAEMGAHPHFMAKEIFEQPRVLENTLQEYTGRSGAGAGFTALAGEKEAFRRARRFVFCGCGTAWHACLAGKHLIERFARVPVDVEYASELRYRDAPVVPDTVFLVVSQSGETLDTLAALRQAKESGHRVLAITNGVGSTIAREADGVIYQNIGSEVSVASTKAFTSQLLLMALLAGDLAVVRGVPGFESESFFDALRTGPDLVRQALEQSTQVRQIARRHAYATGFLFLGRLAHFPIALEGALKLKELSYVHAEGYPAAEMKHGPIALVCPTCPTVFFVGAGAMYPKSLSGIQEIKARQGRVIAIATEENLPPSALCDEIIVLPRAHEALVPLLATIPVQLLSYYFAAERGCDIDRPRNLAKSVTVE